MERDTLTFADQEIKMRIEGSKHILKDVDQIIDWKRINKLLGKVELRRKHVCGRDSFSPEVMFRIRLLMIYGNGVANKFRYLACERRHFCDGDTSNIPPSDTRCSRCSVEMGGACMAMSFFRFEKTGCTWRTCLRKVGCGERNRCSWRFVARCGGGGMNRYASIMLGMRDFLLRYERCSSFGASVPANSLPSWRKTSPRHCEISFTTTADGSCTTENSTSDVREPKFGAP